MTANPPFRTIQLQRDTAANWTSANTLLAEGELGLEMDTRKAKIGDGVTNWNSLQYAFSSVGVGDMLKSENLSGLADYATARSNLGLGSLATQNGTFSGNSSGTNSGDNASNTTSNSYADAKVADAINNGVTTIAPSQNAVFDALALKANSASPLFTGTVTLPTGLTGVIRTDSGVVSIDTDVTDIVSAASLTVAGKVELATTAEINTGTDSTRAIPIDQFVASNRNVRYFDIYAIDKATDNIVGTNIIGAIECPFTGTITEIGAYVETAGVTGVSIWDVNKNGTTIMTTNKLSIDSAEVSTRTAATAPTLTTTAITAGDLITIDTDSLSTTKPKGLHVRIGIRLT